MGGYLLRALSALLGQLPTAPLLFPEPPIELANDLGFFRVNKDLRCTALPFGQIRRAVTMIGPRQKLSSARFFQSSAAGAFENLSAFVFGPHPLPLREELPLGRIPTGIRQKNPVAGEFLNLLAQ